MKERRTWINPVLATLSIGALVVLVFAFFQSPYFWFRTAGAMLAGIQIPLGSLAFIYTRRLGQVPELMEAATLLSWGVIICAAVFMYPF